MIERMMIIRRMLGLILFMSEFVFGRMVNGGGRGSDEGERRF